MCFVHGEHHPLLVINILYNTNDLFGVEYNFYTITMSDKYSNFTWLAQYVSLTLTLCRGTDDCGLAWHANVSIAS